MDDKCAILFSGGTDSFCTAALACEKFAEVHLLTFFERSTQASPVPQDNVNKLRMKYKNTVITHEVISTDEIVRFLSYDKYFASLVKYHLFNLATPGLSSLSWHVSTIRYCMEREIRVVYDGMTKELLHLPGHMTEIRLLFQNLYKRYNIEFSSLVIGWDVPPDQRFVDRLIVDRHGFAINAKPKHRTTGQWLYDRGLLPHPNIKGSLFDQRTQHDCYPFVIYNMLVFWIMIPILGFEKFKLKLKDFMTYKIESAQRRFLIETT